ASPGDAAPVRHLPLRAARPRLGRCPPHDEQVTDYSPRSDGRFRGFVVRATSGAESYRATRTGRSFRDGTGTGAGRLGKVESPSLQMTPQFRLEAPDHLVLTSRIILQLSADVGDHLAAVALFIRGARVKVAERPPVGGRRSPVQFAECASGLEQRHPPGNHRRHDISSHLHTPKRAHPLFLQFAELLLPLSQLRIPCQLQYLRGPPGDQPDKRDGESQSQRDTPNGSPIKPVHLSTSMTFSLVLISFL